MTDLERARKVFSSITFATEVTGCVIEEVARGHAVCALALEPRHKTAMGSAMGGAVFTLADFAFGVASNFDRDLFVTTEAHVHYLTPARGDRLRAEAKEVRSGRSTCLYSVTVTDENGGPVAYLTVAGAKIRERKKKADPDMRY